MRRHLQTRRLDTVQVQGVWITEFSGPGSEHCVAHLASATVKEFENVRPYHVRLQSFHPDSSASTLYKSLTRSPTKTIRSQGS